MRRIEGLDGLVTVHMIGESIGVDFGTTIASFGCAVAVPHIPSNNAIENIDFFIVAGNFRRNAMRILHLNTNGKEIV